MTVKCHHAGSGLPTCDGKAVVLMSVSTGMLIKGLPQCSGCAPDYAQQATEQATRWISSGIREEITITIQPVKGERRGAPSDGDGATNA